MSLFPSIRHLIGRGASGSGTGLFLIAGLGNPEERYEGTRHNAGFAVIDVLAKEEGIALNKTQKKALTGRGRIGECPVLLIKPLTYMNRSGEAIRALSDYYKTDTETHLIVIVDDTALPAGMLRIREKGSAGGHNGLKDIIAQLGHDRFPRLRVGVGEKGAHADMVHHVLSRPRGAEGEAFAESIPRAAQAVRMMVTEGIPKAMNLYNAKKEV